MMLAESIIHSIDPYVFRIGGVGPRWYGMAYVTGFVLGWLLLHWLARTRRILLSPQQVADFVFYVIVGVVAGGRLGHVLLYDPHLLWTFTPTVPWWSAIDITKGGMSSHGGIIGVTLAAWLFARRAGVPFMHLMDCAAIGAPPGLALGRLANWVNGELLGKPLPEEWWGNPPRWSLKFPREILDDHFIRVAELQALRTPKFVDPAAPFPDSLVIAFERGNQIVMDALTPLLTPRWPSQFFQALTDGPVLLAVLVAVWWRPRRPGVVSGWFFLAYGVLRMITEQFRQADEGVLMLGPLTLPMLISLAMIAAGALLILWSSSRPTATVGGLAPSSRVSTAAR
ncbi:MAG: prolipoprotein diacylglyceryl transferase [Phycisphaeraceae bacterium]|nr:prolipoprotein diacylglyceryl transferase [Phycisphaeraceae bacterium]